MGWSDDYDVRVWPCFVFNVGGHNELALFLFVFYSPNTVFFLLINTVYFVCALNVVCVYVRLFLINVGALNVLALFLCVFVFFFTLQMLFIFECGLER